jgi:hypothetical protein
LAKKYRLCGSAAPKNRMDVWEVNAGRDVWLDDAVVILTIAPVFDSIRGADRFWRLERV